MTGAANAHYLGIKAFSETDFTEDLKIIDVPTWSVAFRAPIFESNPRARFQSLNLSDKVGDIAQRRFKTHA